MIPCGVLQVSPANPPALDSLFSWLQVFTAADESTQLLGRRAVPTYCMPECTLKGLRSLPLVAQAAACGPRWTCARPIEKCVLEYKHVSPGWKFLRLACGVKTSGREVGSESVSCACRQGLVAVACYVTCVLATVVRVSLCWFECSCSSACSAVGRHSCFPISPSHPVSGIRTLVVQNYDFT